MNKAHAFRPITGRGGLLTIGALITATLLGATAAPAFADTADERELQLVTAIADVVCAGKGKKEYSYAWYSEYSDIAGRAPYKTSGGANIFLAALQIAFDGPYRFTPWTRQQMCRNLPLFAEVVKDVSAHVKGPLKDCCTAESGLKKFFDDKAQAFTDLFEREDAGMPPYDEKWACEEHEASARPVVGDRPVA